VMSLDPLEKRVEAFGMRTHLVPGHDLEGLAAPAYHVPDGRPLVVLAETCPYQGMEFMKTNAPKFHYTRFKGIEDRARYEKALQNLT
jgi:transketolase